MGRRLTLSCRAMLDVPRRDLAAVLRWLTTGRRPTYSAAFAGAALVDVPDGAPEPQAFISLSVSGRPVVWVAGADDVVVVWREIKEMAFQ